MRLQHQGILRWELLAEHTLRVEWFAGSSRHLFEANLPCAQLFSPRQKAQLDVYGVWGVLRGQLLTDDSFVFNRVLTRLKASVANLAPAEEADEAALAAAKASNEAVVRRVEDFVGCVALVECAALTVRAHADDDTSHRHVSQTSAPCTANDDTSH